MKKLSIIEVGGYLGIFATWYGEDVQIGVAKQVHPSLRGSIVFHLSGMDYKDGEVKLIRRYFCDNAGGKWCKSTPERLEMVRGCTSSAELVEKIRKLCPDLVAAHANSMVASRKSKKVKRAETRTRKMLRAVEFCRSVYTPGMPYRRLSQLTERSLGWLVRHSREIGIPEGNTQPKMKLSAKKI